MCINARNENTVVKKCLSLDCTLCYMFTGLQYLTLKMAQWKHIHSYYLYVDSQVDIVLKVGSFITFTINIMSFCGVFVRAVRNLLKMYCLCYISLNIIGQTVLKSKPRPGLNNYSAYKLSISMPPFPQPLQLQCLNNYRDRHLCQSVL